MVLKPLFLLDLQFGMTAINNARHGKKRLAKKYCLQHSIQQDDGIGACQKMKIKEKEIDSFFINEKYYVNNFLRVVGKW